MTENALITAVREGDMERARTLLDSGADLHEQDEHGWTALSWAAGAGHAELVRVLLDRGADVFAVGHDARTPYLIALAAGRAGAARLLAEAEALRGGDAVARSSAQGVLRPYCRAYELRDLRRFPGWSEPASEGQETGGEPLSDDTVMFLHADFTVTRTIWSGETMVADGTAVGWQRFCTEQLSFCPPDDFDWLPAPPAS